MTTVIPDVATLTLSEDSAAQPTTVVPLQDRASALPMPTLAALVAGTERCLLERPKLDPEQLGEVLFATKTTEEFAQLAGNPQDVMEAASILIAALKAELDRHPGMMDTTMAARIDARGEIASFVSEFAGEAKMPNLLHEFQDYLLQLHAHRLREPAHENARRDALACFPGTARGEDLGCIGGVSYQINEAQQQIFPSADWLTRLLDLRPQVHQFIANERLMMHVPDNNAIHLPAGLLRVLGVSASAANAYDPLHQCGLDVLPLDAYLRAPHEIPQSAQTRFPDALHAELVDYERCLVA